MARRKRVARRARASPKRRSSKASFMGGVTPKVIGGAAYGALRNRAASFVGGLLPTGGAMGLSAAMLLTSVVVSKQRGVLKNVGTAGIYIESANLGSMLASGAFGGNGEASNEVIHG